MKKNTRWLTATLAALALAGCSDTRDAGSTAGGAAPPPASTRSDGRHVAIVLDSGEDAVSLVDVKTYREISRFPIGKEPHHLMATPDDRFLIVANAVSNDLVFLDPHTGAIERRLEDISDPYQIGFSPDRQWFVTVSLRLDRVDIYRADTFSLVKRLTVRSAPSHLAFDAASSTVFVTLQNSDEIAAVSLGAQTLLWKMPVGKTPAGIRMTPDGAHLLVGIMGQNYVEVIDWHQQRSVKKIVTGEGAHNFLPRGDGKHLFVSNRVAGSVCEVDETTLTADRCFEVPGGPDCMEVTRDGSQLWVTSRWVKRVYVVDIATGSIAHTVAVGRSPHGVYLFDHAPRS